MADLLHALTIGKGYDPRDFVVFAYGGAGPTHCHAYGFELGVRAVIVPATATVHSAYGAVASDLHRAFALTDLMRTPPFAPNAAEFLDPVRITSILQELDERARQSMRSAGVADDAVVVDRFVDMRYRYQVNELMIPVPAGTLDRHAVEDLLARFDRKYEELFGKGAAFREAGIELVTFRVSARGRVPKPVLRPREVGNGSDSARRGERPVHFAAAPLPTAVYRGEELPGGSHIAGPAILEYPGTTVVIGPGQAGRVDQWLNVIITLEGTA
jgi:N-methylhydantoinase A